MRSFLRTIFRKRSAKIPANDHLRVNTTRAMSTGVGVAALYACSMTSPTALGAVPEDSKEKAHHLKHGVGFKNPWESWRDFSGPGIAAKMIW